MALGKGVREAVDHPGSAQSLPQLSELGEGSAPALLRMAAQERALSRASLQIFAQTDEASVLRVALNVVSALLHVDVAALFLTSDDAAGIHCRAIRGEGAVEILPPEAALVDAFAMDALQRQTPRQGRSWSPPGLNGRGRCESALAVPLVSQRSALGVLIVGRHEPGRFRGDHVALLASVARHLALALLQIRDRIPHSEGDPAGDARVRELERLKTEFVSMAAHEIRTPLSALQGFTELMLSNDVPANVQRDWLSLMNREAGRLANLVEEMQEMTRSESGQMQLRVTPLDMGAVICRVAQLLDSGGQRVHLLIERVPAVLADGDKLIQVLTNLLRNALDYSPSEQPVEVEVARRCLAQEDSSLVVVEATSSANAPHECSPAVSVAVRDRGIGMTGEELEHVFQPFYRADTSRELQPSGSGLGLAITTAIVERHRGSLWARSSHGQGSVFGFCLPAQGPPLSEGAN